MLELPPKNIYKTKEVIKILSISEYYDILNKVDDEYLYFDKVKYIVPKGVELDSFWSAIKIRRSVNHLSFGNYHFTYPTTNNMQSILHGFDLNFGSNAISGYSSLEKNNHYYVISSLMEEAIASSQMEGSSTTRKIAKEMLRKQIKPKNRDQRMIVNNYNTIRFLVEHKDETLTPELLLNIHSQITEHTLDNPRYEGKFRSENNIFIIDKLTGEIAHNPPDYMEIDEFINQLCIFANNDDKYIHPIIKAIIIHFMISFLHPFADGNGRTARSLFYWYMLKKGYWFIEYLSISRIIYRSRSGYERAFLCTEYDGYDLGYFIQYNLNVLKSAYNDMQLYVNRKKEEKDIFAFSEMPYINDRQRLILGLFKKNQNNMFTCKELESYFNVNVKTIRSDLISLVEMGYLEKVNLNRRLIGYRRSPKFPKRMEENRKNCL